MAADTTRRFFEPKNILYATDFSTAAFAALPYAREFARHYGAKVHVLYVRPSQGFAFVTPEMVPHAMEVEESILAEEISRTHSFFAGLPHDVMVDAGDLWTVCEKWIAALAVDLIVMGTSGRSGASKALLGSVASRILRQASCPVLTVCPHCTGNAHSYLQMKGILYPVDFSPESEAAARFVVSLAREHQSKITLLNVLPQKSVGDLADPKLFAAAKTRLLEQLIPHDGGLPGPPSCIVRSGRPAATILKTAEEEKSDLIVLGVKNVSTSVTVAAHLSRAIAYEVIAKAPCPVLTVRKPVAR